MKAQRQTWTFVYRAKGWRRLWQWVCGRPSRLTQTMELCVESIEIHDDAVNFMFSHPPIEWERDSVYDLRTKP